MNTLTRQLPLVVKQAVDESLRTVPKEVQEKVNGALQHTVAEYRKQYQSAGQEVFQGAHHLSLEMGRMGRLHRMLVWKVLGTTMTCFALLLVGGVWLSAHYVGVIRDNQISAETLKTYNAADLTLCGRGLCANVDVHGKRYGVHNEYVPVKMR